MQPRESLNWRHWVLIALTLAGIAAGFILDPVKQDLAYHDFADQRSWSGVPNAGDVISNLAFLPVGWAGLRYVWNHFPARWSQPGLGWILFFLGVLLTTFGSAFYHWRPTNQTLVWDRLPMTLAFTSLLSLVIRERVHRRAGEFLFWPLVAAGLWSVLYWRWSEERGAENLIFYGLIQFQSILLIILSLALFRRDHSGWGCSGMWPLIGCYAGAKVLESLDETFFNALKIVSGHTLKHVCAAAGVWLLLRSLRKSLSGFYAMPGASPGMSDNPEER